MDLGDARVRGGGVRQTAFEIRVYGRGGQLCGEGFGVLRFGAVFARVVDELVNGGLRTVGVVSVGMLAPHVFIRMGVNIHIHVNFCQLQSHFNVLLDLGRSQALVHSSQA